MVAAASVAPTPEPANTNTVELVRAFAASQPSTRALVDMKTGTARTFAELARDLDDVAAQLRAAGVKPGDRTALFIATGIELTTVMFACFQVGAVPVLIDPGMGASRVLGCIREQKPRVLIGVPKAHVLRTVAFRAFASVEVSLLVAPLGEGAWFPGSVALRWGHRAAVATATRPARRGDVPLEAGTAVHDARGDDVAAILYTSGSTGAPKGVVYTHAMFTGQARAIRDMFDIKPGEVDVACFLPFAFFSIAMGMTAVFPDMDFRFPAKADPAKILAALAGATSAFASPALWEPFSRALDRDLRGLKRVLTAGAPVRPQLHERLLRHLPDGDVYTPYGATEALPVAFMSGRAVVDETAALTRAGKGTCVGNLAPGVDVKIIAVSDDAIANITDARDVPRGSIGEIIVRGPCITRAYDNNHHANRLAKIKDGDSVWHRMGDAGSLDERGRLWFCGRKGQRVETVHGALYSIPVEAVVEGGVERPPGGAASSASSSPASSTTSVRRAALVGLGPRGRQAAVVIVETAGLKVRLASPAEQLAAVRALPGCAHVAAVLTWFGHFPVDRRHNAKIEREQLAAWAAKKLPHLAGGVGDDVRPA